MKKLKLTSLYDNVHFIFIFVILLILTLEYWYLSFLLFIYLIFLVRKTNLILVNILLGVCIIIACFKYLPLQKDTLDLLGIVIQCDENDAVILSRGRKYFIYHKDNFMIGDYVSIKASKINSNDDLFDYEKYLLNKGIFGPYKLNSFEIKDNYFVISKINHFFVGEVDKHPSKYNSYIKSLIFSCDSEMTNIKKETAKIGISHILAVSGMHISILILVVEFLFKKLFYFEDFIDVSVIIFLLCYIVITNFSLTVLRASLMVILTKFFKYKKLLFTKLDVLSIVGIILLVINPRSLFLLSFKLSFIVSFIIIIFASNFKINNKLVNVYFISFIAFLTTLPFIVKQNYEFNIFSIIFGPIFVLFFELILYPTTLIMLAVPKTHLIGDYFFEVFELSVNFLSSIKKANIVVGSISVMEVLIYLVILFFLLSSFELKKFRKYTVMIFIIYLSLIYNRNSFNQFPKVSFYNVGQGDSVLISLPKNEGYILIDCFNNVSDFLKKDGIREIDIIFLTHGHSDHVDAYEEVISIFKVNNTYTSRYDKTEIINKYKKKYEITTLKSDDIINFKNVSFYILGPIKEYSNENDNSLVIKCSLNGINYLFTGDIEDSEYDLVSKYQNSLKSDVIKVAHHGSSTSSSDVFMKYVDPRYLVISVGLNNQYGFPNNKLLLRYKNVYRTDINGTIVFANRKKLKIKTRF